MDYENLLDDLQPTEKEMKDRLAACQKYFKLIVKEAEAGDLKSMGKDLPAFQAAGAALTAAVEQFQKQVDSFDASYYFSSGEFEQQMLACCEKAGVDVREEAPIYEMFPYRIRIDADNQDLYVDRKKVQCMRPAAFVDMVRLGQEKLNKASFNPVAFAGELADAYDLALLKAGKKPGTDLYLQTIYRILTPMSRSRKEYDQQSYAFDLARLYASGIQETKNGRQFQFGPSRNNDKAVRILDQNGVEQYLATIRFF